MLGEAIKHLMALPQDATQRADTFETLAGQIEKQTGGSWSASRGKGTDDSDIFLGRQGEGLVVSPNGKLYRGSLGKGITITSDGLQPDFDQLNALD